MSNASQSSVLRLTLLGLLAFAAGALFVKFKPFPYPQAVAAAKAAKKSWARRSVDPAAVIAKSYSKDAGDPRSSRSLDTALLPLTVRGFKVSATQSFPKGAGSIAVVGDTVVLMDWLGNLYVYEEGQIVKREFPALPNNIEAFVRSLTGPVENLRVHDLEYVPACASLAVSYERFDTEKQQPQIAVSLIAIDPKTIRPTGSWKTVFASEPMTASRYAGQAGGGRLAVKDSAKLLLTVGDFNQDGVMIESERVAQDPKSSFGKILELDWATGGHRMVSLGHRNPQGLLVTSGGDVFSTEHGPAGGDELNRIVEGANYGWPNVSLGTDYGTYDWPNAKLSGGHEGYAMPTFAWLPSIGVSNLIQIENFHPSWNGDLLVASLKASSLFRLRLDGQRVVYSEAIWLGSRIRDIVQLKTGMIVLWTDDAQLLFVEVDQPKLKQNKRGLGYFGQTELAACMTCHHFDVTGPTHLAPSFGNLIGREVASDSFTRYSPALKAKGGAWTTQRLKEFIANPDAFAPGTTMPKLGLSEQDISTIVALLANVRPE